MTLERQNVSVPLSGGIDTKTDAKQVGPGKLTALSNGVFTSLKQISKRNGYDRLATYLPERDASAVATFKDELLAWAPIAGLYTYDEGADKWLSKGAMPALLVGKSPVIRNGFDQSSPDIAYDSASRQFCVVWEDTQSSDVRYAVIDALTGAFVVADSRVSTSARRPKVLAVSGSFLIAYLYSSGDYLHSSVDHLHSSGDAFALYERSMVATNPGTLGPASLLDSGVLQYDATVIDDLVYTASALDPTGIKINIVAADSVVHTVTIQAAVPVAAVSISLAPLISVGSINAVVMWVASDDNSISATMLSTSLSEVKSPTYVEPPGAVAWDCITGCAVGTSVHAFYSVSDVNSLNNCYTMIAVIDATWACYGGTTLKRSVHLAGKPFATGYSASAFVPVSFESVLQSGYFLIDSQCQIIAKSHMGVGGGAPAYNTLGEAVAVGNVWHYAFQAKGEIVDMGGVLSTRLGVDVASFDFASTDTFRRAEIANNLHISGGFLWNYDGQAALEHGFHLFPEGEESDGQGGTRILPFVEGTYLTLQSQPPVPAPTSAGYDYQVRCCYEWTDHQGQTHLSAPSIPVQFTCTDPIDYGHSVTYRLPTLRLTAKISSRNPVRIVCYRTLDTGTVFYRLSVSGTANSPNVDVATFVDTVTDADLIGNQTLYTTGGVVENMAPPPPLALAVYRGRMIAVNSENPLELWYSKQVITGLPVEFSDIFTLNVDPSGGDITALATMDERLIVFKGDRIFMISGQGPDSTGAQSDFSDAQLVNTDVGCVNQRSVVVVPSGLMFQSSKGIYLLDRAFQAQYIGADIESYTSAITTNPITSAQLIPTTNQVRFTVGNERELVLVYDYLVGQWGTFSFVDAVDSVIWNGLFTYIAPDGSVFQETPGVFSDNGAWIRLSLTTSWLQFAGLQGFQRVRRLYIEGNYKGPHLLTCKLQVDLVKPVATAQTVSLAQYAAPVSAYQWRIDIAPQKCEAMQIQLYDAQGDAPTINEGLTISALTLEVGTKRGGMKLPAARTAG